MMKNVRGMLVVLLALVIVSSIGLAAKEAGPLPAPENFDARVRAGGLFFSWDASRGAEKYSVDCKCKVTYFNTETRTRETKEIKCSFGTSDRTDGQPISTPWLYFPQTAVVRIVLAKLAEEGVDRTKVGAFQLECTAKVKALAHKTVRGRQNNAFSEPDDVVFSWTRPS